MSANGSAYSSAWILVVLGAMWAGVGCGAKQGGDERHRSGHGSEMMREAGQGGRFGSPPPEVEPATEDIEVPPAP